MTEVVEATVSGSRKFYLGDKFSPEEIMISIKVNLMNIANPEEKIKEGYAFVERIMDEEIEKKRAKLK